MAKKVHTKELEPKQLRFCQEYVIDFNGTQAAIRAGYSKRTANEQSARMLAKVSIQVKVKELTQKAADKLEITQEKVLSEYAKIAFFDLRTIYDDKNALKQIHQLDDTAGAAIAGIKVFEEFSGTGVNREHIGNTVEIKLNSKISALDSIRDILGYKAPTKVANTDTKGNDVIPITKVEIVKPTPLDED
jgi:phage terminase small subunit